MIRVEDALALAESRKPLRPNLVDLTPREDTQAHYVESVIEAGLYKSFAGGIHVTKIPADLVAPHVIEHVTRRFEESGWAVSLIPVGDTAAVKELFFVVAPITSVVSQVVERWPPERMPPLRRATEELATTGPRLLIRLPTRDRPHQALAVVEKYRRMAGCAVTIEVVVDYNDPKMLRAEVLQRLDALECIVTVGRHQNKIDACNGGVFSEWDILMLASDDMVPVVDGYAVRVIEAMQEHWPAMDGAIFFNDGKQRKELCTLPILGKRLYDQFCFVYAPQYQSLFCDREQTELLTAMGRLTYVNEVLIEHRHHVWGRAEVDALYRRNDALEAVDRSTYEARADHRRRHAQWGFGSPPMWLSIGICTLPERRKQLERLLYQLHTQIKWSAPRSVEILMDDRKDITIGEKRQALLERARGHFISFVDDDDSVSHDYVARVVHAVKTTPDTDCVALNGVITTNGEAPERFEHSVIHAKWETIDGVHLRSPNHLNPVRRELALKVGFKPMNHGEDHDYSTRLLPLLKTEVSAGSDPLYFYWYVSR